MVSVDIAAQLSAGIGELGRHLDRHAQVMSSVERAVQRPPAQPFTTRLYKAAVSSSGSADLVLGLGAPNSGRFWDVRNVVVGGRNWATTVAGTALLVVTGTHPTSADSVGIDAVHDEATSLPLPAFYGSGQIRIRFPERLFIIVVAPTASTEYHAAATIEQYEEGIREQTAES